MVNENYSRFFRAFLEEQKLSLAEFDAVIGPEYVRGGTQVCVRNPVLQAQIRGSMVQVPLASEAAAAAGSAAEVATTAEAVAGRGRALAVTGRVAAVAIEALIFAVIVLALEYLRVRAEQEKFREKMRAAQPQIEAALVGQNDQIRALQSTSAGRTVWAQITIWIDSQGASTSTMAGIPFYDHSFVDAGFATANVGLNFGATRTSKPGKSSTWPHQYGATTYTPRRDLVTYSVPVPYDPAALPDLMSRNERIRHIERDAATPGLPEGVVQVLFEEREAFLKFGPQVYGPPAPPRVHGPPAPARLDSPSAPKK